MKMPACRFQGRTAGAEERPSYYRSSSEDGMAGHVAEVSSWFLRRVGAIAVLGKGGDIRDSCWKFGVQFFYYIVMIVMP